ncbi:hypothetical protein Bca52824_079023 [Brassica carinata]|uniref:Uncharacterized protein n=1 Tax=Brassica carinata TaxID=52824 RepID=A0A8X7PWL6_BRACI|nr:hypothetical protein Bca52824_079023 [Brassica carinata]
MAQPENGFRSEKSITTVLAAELFLTGSDPYHALYRWYKSSTASEGEGDDDAKPYPTFRLNLGYFMRMLFCFFLYGLIIVAERRHVSVSSPWDKCLMTSRECVTAEDDRRRDWLVFREEKQRQVKKAALRTLRRTSPLLGTRLASLAPISFSFLLVLELMICLQAGTADLCLYR